MRTAGVLGAGLQGCCVALALARRGWSVTLYDRRPRALAAASDNQEGKIHLGFVYAADPSRATARSMIEGALGFSRAIDQLVGEQLDWQSHLSRRFRCAIHRDSTLSKADHESHFEALQAIYTELLVDPRASYLGRRPRTIWHREPYRGMLDPELVSTCYRTEEAAVDSTFVNDKVRSAVRDSGIRLALEHHVRAVEATDQPEVGGDSPVGAFGKRHDVVINCLWEGRLAVDRSVGLVDDGPWITRIKYGFLLDADETLTRQPSLVLTHGPFGDIVTFPRAKKVYASWYPACRVALTEGILGQEWQALLAGRHDSVVVHRALEATRRELEPFFPGLAKLPLVRVLAGSIVGRGASDIDNSQSGLHRRVDEAPRRQGAYYSLFTGKYTLAPVQAQRLAAQVEQDFGR